MSHIQFESGWEKDRARQELRDARNELLLQAEQRSRLRDERLIQKKLRGEDQLLPSVSKKLQANEELLKESKEKRRKKKSKSSASESSSRNIKEKKGKYSTESSASSASEDEWIEKKPVVAHVEKALEREDWLCGMSMPTFSNKPKDTKKDDRHIDSYDPRKCSRELNPFWKNGGDGLPSFKKPKSESDDDDRERSNFNRRQNVSHRSNGWRKHDNNYHNRRKRSTSRERSKEQSRDRKKSSRSKSPIPRRKNSDSRESCRETIMERSNVRRVRSRSKTPEHRRKYSEGNSSERTYRKRRERSRTPSSNIETKLDKHLDKSNEISTDFLTDQQMNELGAKLIKAEIMGNDKLASELSEKLEKAREYRNTHKSEILTNVLLQKEKVSEKKEHIMLTKTNSQGVTKPLCRQTKESDLWGGRAGRKKSKKVETHLGGERVRYFADDDKYDIKQMFESEKFVSAADQDEQFVEIAGKLKNPNDDIEDIFSDMVRNDISQSKIDDLEKAKAIRQHEELKRTLDSCDKCFESPKMEKQLIITIGSHVYITLPRHEGLQTGHCMIVPMQHVSCSTHLDEDVWKEVQDYRKAITRMFQSRKQDVIFFETVRYLNKNPHMVIHCVPNKDFELAPFYFKKAIQESEREWSTNKQLIPLKDKDIRRSIPKGLPYFWVHFGMEQGLAHVIEEQDRFPSNFAQETIGGLLNLDSRLWRRPRIEQNVMSKVKQFADWWKHFDVDV